MWKHCNLKRISVHVCNARFSRRLKVHAIFLVTFLSRDKSSWIIPSLFFKMSEDNGHEKSDWRAHHCMSGQPPNGKMS